MIEPCHWPSKHIPNIEVRGEGGNTTTMDFWVFDHFVHHLTEDGAFPSKFVWPLVDSASDLEHQVHAKLPCFSCVAAATRLYVTSFFVVYHALCWPVGGMAWGALSEETDFPAGTLGSCLDPEKSRTCNPLRPDSGWSECKYDFLHPQGPCQGVGSCVYVGGAQML